MIPVILSGGVGSRLWPVSRRAHPKPFMQLADGETLAEKTWNRARAVAGRAPILTVTSRDYYFYTRDLYQGLPDGDHQARYLLEPMGRNTAPAIALAAFFVRENLGDEATMLVMPADHLVSDQRNFEAAVHEAQQLASQDLLVTFGIHPTHAETGYGYIRQGEPLTASGSYRIDAFVEKPDIETAREYLESGKYHWNSGMFCFRASAVLDALAKYSAPVYEAVKNVWLNMDRNASPLEIPAELFAECPSISIDYAVMEKVANSAVVAADFGWSDIGSWKAISELYESDAAGNRIRGKAVLVESTNCFVQGGGRLVAAVGVDNLVIVDTGDAVLVADRNKAQDVKQVVAQLTELKDDAATYHQTVHRPWGSYTILEDADDCKVKRLVVKPGQVLSLQLHHRRSEHWTVVRGIAKVRRGDDEFLLEQNQSTYIPVETLHRLENPGTEDVHLIEVQTGDYFGEDDIERFEDIYGRVK
ncbi:MAG: mannose-1-phosphate guanylyltransferase/mannose-6-phosphate isomerase [Xanthomonadales bacterium]|nr:mannose-1-phosphate guanylyltransferase/mannose-6-phosphate isomerase [Gammaproteobacteria bacterium]NNE05125.1 mannose-1-phosphate guanylyltransferase/mannose-6-phosphate isomerase [Xanthomonadales bacterium]NNL95240.1 mannose-1-phosphate guanylyltransferase/mannose-6-phosphate isomerase [Xanthomonadales bacterium]